MRNDLDEILLTEEQIQHRLDGRARKIQRGFAGKGLPLVGALKVGVVASGL